MKTGLIIAIILIVIAIGGIFFYQSASKITSQEKEAVTDKSGEVMEKEGEVMDKPESAQSPQTQATIPANLLAGTTSPYYEFNPTAYSKALAENKVILIYFYADWCPICKREQADATLPAFNELQKSNVVGFRVHYNDGKATAEERDLAKQYGITYQHTKIILKDGKQVSKDLNSWNKEKYLAEFSQY